MLLRSKMRSGTIKTVVAKTLIFFLLGFAAMVLSGIFGIVHDQISYTVSPEYFTLFKFPQFGIPEDTSPRLGAVFVGFLASWWMGIPIGFVLATAGLFAPTPRLMLRRTLTAYPLVALITICVGLLGLLVGVLTLRDAASVQRLDWYLPENLKNVQAFGWAGYMHNATYLGGAVGLLIALIRQAFTIRLLPTETPAKEAFTA